MNIRLSHSALETFHTCERMFQLDRLLTGAPDKQDYPATVFGKAYGEGVSSYLISQDRDLSIYNAWKAYSPILEDSNRTEEILLNLLINTFPKLDNLLLDWEVAIFQDKPAVELSFRLNISSPEDKDNIYFVGYVDVVLKNRYNGNYAILENKTTGMQLLDLSSMYKNSGQALGYSIVLDRIAGEEHSYYDVIYCIGQLQSRTNGGFSPKVHIEEYAKTLKDRLDWFITLGMDVQRLEQMLSYNVFPRRGNNCVQYGRACKHFGTCNLQNLDRYKETEEDTIEYQFTYNLQDLINSHIERN